MIPAHYSADVFLSGFAYMVPEGGLPAGTRVTWQAHFSTSENCLSVNWKWAAAVCTSSGENAHIGVKPVDDNQLSLYKNSDHAGTPEYETAYLTRGARGGGGSNYTGSYSGTLGIRGGSCP
ncbi:MAG: hypothetical protein KGI98_04330 [Euryarchaeota archaeon]|nr:hypothetical protein [Euryarchaeota archaeon]MDE1880828.1 hypothetical protein [Euryarchaeota archaeon]